MNNKTAVIIGAGPAGLTAAYELINKTDIKPVVFEMTGDIGGIAKTVEYKGNLIDIGGHRFFSKSDIIMEWWQKILPLQKSPFKNNILPFPQSLAPDPDKTDRVMLIRRRLSRIFYQRKFFAYPVSFSFYTFLSLGVVPAIKMCASYFSARLLPIKKERSLEDFLINRFGKELFSVFFKDYTEKVWGVAPSSIKPEWGEQRIKGLSITQAALHSLKSLFLRNNLIAQKNIETSLIEYFMYPKFGPGQLWGEVSGIIKGNGGQIHTKHKVVELKCQGNIVTEVYVKNELTGGIIKIKSDYFFSTMPVKDLVKYFGEAIPQDVKKVAEELKYRDLITAGILLKKLKIRNNTKTKAVNDLIPDNWIYIQEKDVKLGRLQIFNNWSPYLVKDKDTVWIGLEYFCNQGDDFWQKSDEEIFHFAVEELAKLDFIDRNDLLDGLIIRTPKAYPVYCGGYENFESIRNFTDKFENLFLIGRNGMHRYNNMDHSMLTAITGVENIIKGIKSKDNIWNINTDKEYYEEDN